MKASVGAVWTLKPFGLFDALIEGLGFGDNPILMSYAAQGIEPVCRVP
jgi:hypothetical protein